MRAILATAAIAAGLLSAVVTEAGGLVRTADNYRQPTAAIQPRLKDAVGLAINPRNPRHIVQVNADWPVGECEFHVSFDGGRRWRSGRLRVPPGFRDSEPCQVGDHLGEQIDGGVAFGSRNNVYATFATARVNQAGEEDSGSAFVARSTNGGRTFRTAVEALPGGPPSSLPQSQPAGPNYILPKVVADGRRVYVVTGSSRRLAGGRRLQQTVVSRSDDAGNSFGPPVVASRSDEEEAIEQSQPVIGRGGALYVAYRTVGRPERQGGPGNPVGLMTVARSLDRGRSFQQVRTARVMGYVPERPFTNEAQGNVFTASTFPRLAADRRSGNLYLVYGNGGTPQQTEGGFRAADHFIHPDMDVWFQRSINGGANWSTPKLINNAAPKPGTPITQTRHPNVSVAPNGRVDIVWHDRRHWYAACTNTHGQCEEARLGDTYYAYSTNRGRSFSRNRRITDKSINNDVGTDYRFGAYWDYGPVSVPIGRNRVLFAWMDSRHGNVDNDNMDIELATLNLRASRRIPVRRVPRRSAVDLSVRLSRMAYQGGGEAVLAATFASRPFTRPVIVNHRDPAAALAAGVLARANIGPVLLSPRGRLPRSVRAEIGRLEPVVGAYVIGDQRSLSDRVIGDLAAAGVPGNAIARISGSDQASTARAIALAYDRRNSADREAGNQAFDAAVIANPRSRVSSAVSGLAASRRLPVLFVNRNSIPPATAAALRELGIRRTLVVGGSSSVSGAVRNQLPSPERLSNSREVVAESIQRGLPTNIGFVAHSGRPIDGAVMGGALGRINALLLLSPRGQATAARTAASFRLGRHLDRLIVADGRGKRFARRAPRFTG